MSPAVASYRRKWHQIMYSGTTLTNMSGRIMGAHQKIDRVARRHLAVLLNDNDAAFPAIRQILKFEGLGGPDGIKKKSPAKDEPWHYMNPFDESDEQLLQLIRDHHDELVKALRAGETTRAAFEAAWFAHALVDGLTPAHHFPYEEELVKLRGGQSIETRDTIVRKLVMPGQTRSKQLINNWKMWGPKGLMTTHGAFELGIANLITTLSFKDALPSSEDIIEFEERGLIPYYKRKAKEIAALGMYESFYESSWTPKLIRQVRRELTPTVISVVVLAWHAAAKEAGIA